MDKSPLFRNESHYRLNAVQANDRKETERSLLVNCCGFSSFSIPIRVTSRRKDYYLIYPVEGRLEISAPCKCVLRPGQAVIFSPDTPFAYHSRKFTYYWVHFSGTAADTLLSESGLQTDQILCVGKSEEGEGLLRRIFYAFHHRKVLWERSAALDLERFLLLCGSAVTEERSDKSEETVARAVTYIRSHLGEALSIASLAEQSHMSLSGFRRAFTAYTGHSPAAFVQEARLTMAAQLLRDTDLKVATVAHSVGYPDALYFSRLFRRYHGQSPIQYRRQHRV